MEGRSILHLCGIHCIRLFQLRNTVFAVTGGDDGYCGVFELNEKKGAFEKLKIRTGHVGGVKSVSAHVNGEELQLLTFTYDQLAELFLVNIRSWECTERRRFSVSVSDGEFVDFIRNGFVAFGNGIQFISL
jgi:hypothetical protein